MTVGKLSNKDLRVAFLKNLMPIDGQLDERKMPKVRERIDANGEIECRAKIQDKMVKRDINEPPNLIKEVLTNNSGVLSLFLERSR